MNFVFDPELHEYRVDGRVVPYVTQILDDVIGLPFQASEWYLERGRAVHACCAMIARGIEFDHDERIAGQVAASRKFFAQFNPRIVEVETPHYSEKHGYAGTPDLVCQETSGSVVYDFKASVTKCLPYQIAAYCLLTNAKAGRGVVLHEDGEYAVTPIIKLDSILTARWLSILAVWKIKKEVGA